MLILLSLLFTACQSEDSGLMIVPDEIKTEIETTWQQTHGVVYEWSDGENDGYYTVRYYGTYQGAVVRMYEGAAQGTTGFNVAGEFFMWFHGFGIHVYKDGEFYSLQEAYENGLLTEKHIKSIAEQHDKYIYETIKARH